MLEDLSKKDPVTGWFEIIKYKDKHTTKIANLLEQTWLFRYSRPTINTYGRENELLTHAVLKDLIINYYGIK